MKIGVTGANGFIGRHLIGDLQAAGHTPVALVRSPEKLDASENVEAIEIPSIDAACDIARLEAAMQGLDVVVHLAASVHDMQGTLGETAYHDINFIGSGRVFEAAKAAGVGRFIFISSVKAAGERSGDRPLDAENAPGPEDAYGRSKRDAEALLGGLAAESGCRLVILRPTFVYGWPAVGNFKTLLKAVLKRWPLPLAAIRNRRDLTYVGNLTDAICAACSAENLGQGPYFICDGAAVSTPALVSAVGGAFFTPARLIYVPVSILRFAGMITGRSAMIERLCGNLEVDHAPFSRDAGWQAPYNMADGLRACAQAYDKGHQGGA